MTEYKIDGEYVILEDADFEAADAIKTTTIDIQSFGFEKEIESIY